MSKSQKFVENKKSPSTKLVVGTSAFALANLLVSPNVAKADFLSHTADTNKVKAYIGAQHNDASMRDDFANMTMIYDKDPELRVVLRGVTSETVNLYELNILKSLNGNLQDWQEGTQKQFGGEEYTLNSKDLNSRPAIELSRELKKESLNVGDVLRTTLYHVELLSADPSTKEITVAIKDPDTGERVLPDYTLLPGEHLRKTKQPSGEIESIISYYGETGGSYDIAIGDRYFKLTHGQELENGWMVYFTNLTNGSFDDPSQQLPGQNTAILLKLKIPETLNKNDKIWLPNMISDKDPEKNYVVYDGLVTQDGRAVLDVDFMDYTLSTAANQRVSTEFGEQTFEGTIRLQGPRIEVGSETFSDVMISLSSSTFSVQMWGASQASMTYNELSMSDIPVIVTNDGNITFDLSIPSGTFSTDADIKLTRNGVRPATGFDAQEISHILNLKLPTMELSDYSYDGISAESSTFTVNGKHFDESGSTNELKNQNLFEMKVSREVLRHRFRLAIDTSTIPDIDDPVGVRIDAPGERPGLNIYPNPILDESSARIDFVLPKAGRATISVYDAKGNLVLLPANNRPFDQGDNTLELDLSKRGLSNGMYYLQIHQPSTGWMDTVPFVKM